MDYETAWNELKCLLEESIAGLSELEQRCEKLNKKAEVRVTRRKITDYNHIYACMKDMEE